MIFSFGTVLTVGPGCGGGGTAPKKKKKKKKKKKPKERKGQALGEDPTIEKPASQELKDLVLGLGAKDEALWRSAEGKIKEMGEAAIPGLNWGLKFPLQNIRARCCNIMSKMKKSNAMVPGAMKALKVWRDDTSPQETGIRRWAAKLLSDLYTIYTETAMRDGAEHDKDIGVRIFLAGGVAKLGHKTYIPLLFTGMADEDEEVAGWAAVVFTQVIPHAGFDPSGFSGLGKGERQAKAEELRGWWKANKAKTKPIAADRDYEPWPVNVEVYTFDGPSEEINWEDQREVDLNVQDAEEALANGDIRKATAKYAAAFRFSQRSRMDIALKQHECWRKLGPDNADKSYKYLREKLIPLDPMNEELWLAAARSAWASRLNERDNMAREWAKECLKMVLILVPDHGEAKGMLSELGN
jgi:hypothetical protein